MDKKPPNESETWTEEKLFADDDVAPADSNFEQNT